MEALDLNKLSIATVRDFLIVFIDLSNFSVQSAERDPHTMFRQLNQFYEMVDNRLSSHGGRVIKYIGDAALVIFPQESVNEAIETLLKFKKEVDIWLKKNYPRSNLSVFTHFGEACVGQMGGDHLKYFDVIGHNVNLTAMLARKGKTEFRMSPEAWARLRTDLQKRFRLETEHNIYTPVS